MSEKRRVLVSGFGPFPGVPHNVSAEISRACAERWSEEFNVDAAHLELQTNWITAPGTVCTALQEHRPDVAILLGVSGEARGLTLETHAYNAACSDVDVDGNVCSTEVLIDNGPLVCETTAPVSAIEAALLEVRLPVSCSDDPGRYLCNAVYHRALRTIHAAGMATHCVFVHLPSDPEACGTTVSALIDGLTVTMRTLLSTIDKT